VDHRPVKTQSANLGHSRLVPPPWSWAVASMVLIQLGAALSHPMLLSSGPVAVTWLRLCWASVLLLAFVRPFDAWREVLAGRAWSAVALGVASGVMTLCYFESLARIPQGMANAIEFLGPLSVAVIGSRRARDLLWAALAAVGVALLLRPGKAWQPDAAGIAYAAAAAVCWGLYIVLTKRVGARFAGFDGIAVSLTIAALVTSPAGLAQAWGQVSARDVLAAGGLAILIPVLPYVLELAALRRLSTSSFGILMSAEPAIACLIGAVLLAQIPGPLPAIGFLCVIAASVGTLRSQPFTDV
jgi:inner membrane transporter RhtA